MKKKIKLNDFKVVSFVTDMEQKEKQTIAGGHKESALGRVCQLSIFNVDCDCFTVGTLCC